MQAYEIFLRGLSASFVAGLGTMVGAVWVFFFRRPSPKTQDALLSGAAGVMLAATFFSLLQPALQHAQENISSKPLAVLVVILGLLGGALGLYLIHSRVPHEHFVLGKQGPDTLRIQRLWLFIISDEIIPETHRNGYEDTATFSLLGGFAVMMFLDAVFA